MASQQHFTVTEVAEQFGVGRHTVLRWLRKGFFKGAVKAPGRTAPWKIPQSDVVAFRKKRFTSVPGQVSTIARSTVLIIEDDPDTASILESLAGQLELYTFKIASGDRAVEWATSIDPDVINLDLALPGTSGKDVLKHIRSSSLRDVPVIVVTAFDHMLEDIVDQADDVLVKPFRMDDLKRRLVKVLEGR